MDYAAFVHLCKNRRSIRYFDQTPIKKEDVLQLLELARLAPSVENLQPWHFHVITNKDLCKKLMESSCYGNFVEGAGVFIVITCDRTLERKAPEIVWNLKELEYSCMTAAEHILLGATAMGLGSCWVSLHHGAPHTILKLREQDYVIGGIMLGHYKPGEAEASNGRDRKPLTSMITMYE